MRWPGALLSSFLSFQECGVLSSKFLHSCRDSPLCLAAPSGQAPTPARVAPPGARLDGASARQQQLVIGLMASERILSTFVRLLSLMLEVEVPYSNLIQGWSPLFERMRRSPHHLISGPGSILVPRSLIRTVRGHRAPRRMGPIFTPAFFSHGFRRPHIHLGSVRLILSAIETLWLFSYHPFFRAMSVGSTPASRYRHRQISSLRATATMLMRRMRPLRVPTRSRNQALNELPGW